MHRMDPEFLLRELLETGKRVVSAIEHHQISLQSVWEGIDSIENAITRLAEIAERFDTRDDEQFRWRVEARQRDAHAKQALKALAEEVKAEAKKWA